MAPREGAYNYQRTFHHRNLCNKKGGFFKFQKVPPNPKHQSPVKDIKTAKSAPPEATVRSREFGDVVVRPPRSRQQRKRKGKREELRFALPNVPQNANIIQLQYARTHAKYAVVLRDLKTLFSIKFRSFELSSRVEVL